VVYITEKHCHNHRLLLRASKFRRVFSPTLYYYTVVIFLAVLIAAGFSWLLTDFWFNRFLTDFLAGFWKEF
jgi:uncharacterized membrane protein YjjP (DUF1212 family)